MVASVRSQKFFPDVTRSGRSLRLPLLPHLQAVLRSRALGRLRDDTSSSSDSSAVSADSDDADEQLVASAPHFVENLLVVGGFATNRKSGLLHVVRQAAFSAVVSWVKALRFLRAWTLVPKTSVVPVRPVLWLPPECGAGCASLAFCASPVR